MSIPTVASANIYFWLLKVSFTTKTLHVSRCNGDFGKVIAVVVVLVFVPKHKI